MKHFLVKRPSVLCLVLANVYSILKHLKYIGTATDIKASAVSLNGVMDRSVWYPYDELPSSLISCRVPRKPTIHHSNEVKLLPPKIGPCIKCGWYTSLICCTWNHYHHSITYDWKWSTVWSTKCVHRFNVLCFGVVVLHIPVGPFYIFTQVLRSFFIRTRAMQVP